MRIAFVNPIARRMQGYHTIGSKIPQHGLGVLAKQVPAEHEIELIDEIFGSDQTEPLIRSGKYDLVALTSYTSGAPRAYEIAKACRESNVKVIMGGPHAWACPDEVGEYCDSVVVGECEEIFPGIVDDAASGRLQPRYDAHLPELGSKYGSALQTLTPVRGKYQVSCLQTSRGCPIGCDFCSVTLFNGSKIRRREIGAIVEEWNSTPRNFIFVVDDNFFGVGKKHAEWSKELLRAIIKHGRKRLWFSQTSVNMGSDIEGLSLAYKAGCRGMLVGFESIHPEALKEYHKGLNLDVVSDYKELVAGFHKAGISVFGAFIIGADFDDMDSVSHTARESVRLGVDTIQMTNLTPLPGTRLYNKRMEDGRIFATNYPQDWEQYTFTETVYHPKKMTAEEMDRAVFELRVMAAERPWVWKRTLHTLLRTRSLAATAFIHGMNNGWKRMAKIQVAADKPRIGEIQPDATERIERLKQAFAMK